MRRIFFWLHLTAGSIAGVVILIMSLTGVLLAFQRQIIHWADSGYRQGASGAQTLKTSPETLLLNAAAAKGTAPTALTLRSDHPEPAAVEFGRESILYLDPQTGNVLGLGSSGVRAFFRSTENWHRWLAAGLQSRATARGVTGASNLLFLGLLLSGLYLWIPKKWTRQHLRRSVWFRRGLNGKARDWNWHNTIGIWCALPLLMVVSSGVVMSYPWANELVYKLTGSPVPAQNGGGGRGGREGAATDAPVSFAGIDALWHQAESRTPDWKAITLRVPPSDRAPVQFQIDSGDGGRPDLRSILTLNRRTGEVIRWEPFSSLTAGRRLRSWVRFSHTGEAGGIAGESVAAAASTGACFLVITGIALAIRRLSTFALRKRSQPQEI